MANRPPSQNGQQDRKGVPVNEAARAEIEEYVNKLDALVKSQISING